MPINSDGNKVPFTTLDKTQIIDYAARLWRLVTGGQATYNETAVVQKVGQKFHLSNDDFLATVNMVRTASATNVAASAFNMQPDSKSALFGIPLRAGPEAQSGKYQYTLLVSARNSVTGEMSNSQIRVYRDSVVSLDDLQRDATAKRAEFSHVDSPPAGGRPGTQVASYTYSVSILAVGQIRG